MNFIKKFKVLIIFVIILLAVVGYFLLKPEKPPRIDTVKVELTDLKQFVSVVGNVKAAKNADLAFENGGKVSKVHFDVGDHVNAGDVLAELNVADLQADLQQAKAQVSSAEATLGQYKAVLSAEQARLDEMKSGTRLEEIKIAQTKVDNAKSDLSIAKLDLETTKTKAQTDLENLYDDVINTLNDGHTKADNAINTQLDDLFTNVNNVDFTFEPNNSQLEVNALTARRDSLLELTKLRTEIDKVHTSNLDFDNALSVGKTSLLAVRYFLNLVGDVLDGDVSLSTATLATYKTNLNTAKTNVNTALTSISNLQQSILAQKNTNIDNINSIQAIVDGAEFDLRSAEDELNLKLAGYTKEQVDAQTAKVQQAEANIVSQRAIINQKNASVESAQAKIEKNIIHSPIKGVITKQDAKEGEIVSANTIVISIISELEFEIEAYITEVDISKIKIGNKAQVVLDAYGDDELFEASVVSIDPAERVIEGVSTYKTTLQFSNGVEKIRSGMTADLEIMTNHLENIIAIPLRAVLNKDNNKVVRKLVNGEIVYENVTTGLRGSDGKVEILSGIKEGEIIITFIEE
ncbi:MAG: hypothetical protein A2725_04280 [Candidatus Magasanikbacteria bacterium RIFCSPHIGHO2_01_FULL_33_34]|uniref:Multidrug resistance protein MdtA-like barrel-sandwich hybrid domain-containing protein n=1 Tax=Candidatus Magasanikbacteria bacterium RIFCSPHIGHO2_01_FULL_33_34 TaxID=1798671 RepID=A0A1F6LHW7_9BACT|nr:MAG: hypothetical protein A2725_04280 [Candidatus Magasanikbacteria bacterium RIFCSPHIGHO2_01_FULL_33_34]OGH65183.1 MAG: hypothetical protein A3B83_04040 [Candidatus Magasanikbacteria bacterium RIFCSPHIGHO2_02_FULL_33_17]OGH75272.1 MAG: hypothetical protein A3A89_04125 [Candidatus Magasanikbacteria bacterium RIFCSPLOWO2_01_FULL_33_34]